MLLYSQVSSVGVQLASLDIDRYERDVLASCYNVSLRYLVGSISILFYQRCLASTFNNNHIRVSQVKLGQLLPPPTMLKVTKACPVQPQRHGVHSAVESKNSCPVPVSATLILVPTYMYTCPTQPPTGIYIPSSIHGSACSCRRSLCSLRARHGGALVRTTDGNVACVG